MHSSRKSGQFGKAMSEALVTVGERFGLYRKIAEIGPATPAEIAHEAGVPEKQVAPWLRSQAEADYLRLREAVQQVQQLLRVAPGGLRTENRKRKDTQMQTKTIAALIVLGTMFGAAFLFMKVIIDEIAVTELVAGRLALGAVTVLILAAVLRRSLNLAPKAVGAAAVLVVLDSIIPYTLVATGEDSIDSGTASVLISLMPVFTVLLASIALPSERPSLRGIAGLGLGVTGVAVLAGDDLLDVTSGSTLGMLAVVGAALSYAVAAVYAKVLLKHEDAVGLTAVKLSIGAVIAMGITLVLHGAPDYGSMSTEGAASLVALGVISTGLVFAGYFWLIGAAGSVTASLVTYVVPVAGLLLGWIVLGEEIGANTIAGAALIAAGCAGVMYHPKAKEAQVPEPAVAVLRGREEFA